MFEISELTRVLLRSSVHSSGNCITGDMESIPVPQALKPVRHHHRHSCRICYPARLHWSWTSCSSGIPKKLQADYLLHLILNFPPLPKLCPLIYPYLTGSGFTDFIPLLGDSDTVVLPWSSILCKVPFLYPWCPAVSYVAISWMSQRTGWVIYISPIGLQALCSSSCHYLVWHAMAQDLHTHTDLNLLRGRFTDRQTDSTCVLSSKPKNIALVKSNSHTKSISVPREMEFQNLHKWRDN